MLLEEGACEEMMEHFTLMIRIEQRSGKQICKKNMNEGNEWNKIEDSNTVQGLIERVFREEIIKALKHMIEMAPGPSDVYAA